MGFPVIGILKQDRTNQNEKWHNSRFSRHSKDVDVYLEQDEIMSLHWQTLKDWSRLTKLNVWVVVPNNQSLRFQFSRCSALTTRQDVFAHTERNLRTVCLSLFSVFHSKHYGHVHKFVAEKSTHDFWTCKRDEQKGFTSEIHPVTDCSIVDSLAH